MEGRKVVDRPLFLQAIHCKLALAPGRCHGVGTENDHVEAARRGVVDPFCGKKADGVKGGQVHLFGVDQFIFCRVAEIFDVVIEEGVGRGMVCKEDDLGAAGCEILNNRCSYAGGTTLETKFMSSLVLGN